MELQPVSPPNTSIPQPQFSGASPMYPTPPSQNKSLLILTGIFLILLAIFSGVVLGKYLYGQKIAPPTTEVQPTIGESFPTTPSLANPTPDLMADWKTYKNESLGFELEYPASIQIDKELDDQFNRLVIFKGGDLDFEVRLRNNLNNVALDKYYFMDTPIKRKTTLASKSANVYEMPSGYCDGPSCSKPYIAIVTERDSTFYCVSFFGDIQLSEEENQILSTFKFLQ